MNWLLTAFSAFLLPLALPNELFHWGLALPGLVALIPALLVVYRVSDRRLASRHGLVFGVISTAVGNYWLAFFGDFSVWTIGGAVVGYAGYNYLLFGFLHFLAHQHKLGPLRPLIMAVAWTGYEYLKSVGFLGYPWGLVAYPLAQWNWVAQAAEFGGVWVLSFAAAYVNSAGAELLRRRDTTARWIKIGDGAMAHGAAAVLVVLVLAGFGAWRLPTLKPQGHYRLLLVQQNVDSWQPGRFADALAQAQRLSLQNLVKPVDAVVWSETALRRPYSPNSEFYRSSPPELPFRLFLERLGVPLITGAPQPAAPGSRDATNSALVIAPDGTLLGSYGKQQLVPFAESIPLWHLPAVQTFFRDVIGLYGTWVPGSQTEPTDLPLQAGGSVAIGMPICFEDAFGWVPRQLVNNGAELLVNLTNNSWSRQNSAQTQHFVAARLRTIELRTTLVRGTNSGLSTVVDARGVVGDTLPMFESTAAIVEVPVYAPQWTLYRQWGDWMGQLAAITTVGLVIVLAIHRRRE